MKAVLKPTISATIPVVLVIAGCAHERELEADRTQEMISLLDTAGRTVVATIAQHLAKPVPGTYIGSGKIDEIKALLAGHDAKEVVFDVQLSPRQQRNIEEETAVRVLDYDELILEIFAGNARTHQAMLAVELAKMEYTKGRLRRMWTHLDRQTVGGNSGSGSGFLSGTGEKQIEMDRRQLKKRIQDLKGKLEEIAERSDRTVKARKEAFTIALVGYTNAGKSTLMNALTNAGVLAENRLFATLDTRTARLHIEAHKNVVLSDTVGFIRNLPHSLIASFHATLSEVREADLLLHVVDSASPVMEEQMRAVDTVLATIAAGDIPVVVVFNKVDCCPSKTVLSAVRRRHKHSVAVSALSGEGLDQLRAMIAEVIQSAIKKVTIRYPATEGALDAHIRSRAAIHAEDFDGDQVLLTIAADERLLNELAAHPQVSFDRS
jgi:GTP-binding protein HflX